MGALSDPKITRILLDLLDDLPPLIVCDDGVARPEPSQRDLAYVAAARSAPERAFRAERLCMSCAVRGFNYGRPPLRVFAMPMACEISAPWQGYQPWLGD